MNSRFEEKTVAIFWVDLQSRWFMAGRCPFCWWSLDGHSCVGGHVVCPETGEEGSIDNHRQERILCPMDRCPYTRVSFIVDSSHPVFCKCLDDGCSLAMFPWRFEIGAIDRLLATRNQTQTAELWRCGFQVVHGRFNRAVAIVVSMPHRCPFVGMKKPSKKKIVMRRFSAIQPKGRAWFGGKGENH